MQTLNKTQFHTTTKNGTTTTDDAAHARSYEADLTRLNVPFRSSITAASRKNEEVARALYLDIDLNADFYALNSDQKTRVLEAADRAKYRQPKNANGSRARYYFARLQRLNAAATR